MVQNAIVKEVIKDGVVRVSLLRQMECGMHCDGACAGCSQKPSEEILALAENGIGAEVGDFVEVESTGVGNISVSLIVFLLPCRNCLAKIDCYCLDSCAGQCKNYRLYRNCGRQTVPHR